MKKTIYDNIFDEIGGGEYILMLQNTPEAMEEIEWILKSCSDIKTNENKSGGK